MRITAAEALYLQRRRLGLSQEARAEQLGVPVWAYAEMEAGERPAEELLPSRRQEWPVPNKVEKCVLRRRRDGVTQREVAEKIGCSRLWVNRMEGGKADPTKLIQYWRV